MAALHGDAHLRTILEAIIERHGVLSAVETGTFHGDTAAWFGQRVRRVVTIEAREDFYRAAQLRLAQGHPNVHTIHGDSATALRPAVEAQLDAHAAPVLCWLDAHWQDAWPLADELRVLDQLRARHPNRLIVVVDDLRVPGYPNFQGPDGGGGTPGHPTYGPKSVDGGVAADITGFPQLRAWPELWWPGYGGTFAGYAIVSDVPLDMAGLPVWEDEC